MLRDGKFIKEKPPKIGSHYVKPIEREYSEEEKLMQEVNLGYKPESKVTDKDVVIWLLAIYFVFLIFTMFFR